MTAGRNDRPHVTAPRRGEAITARFLGAVADGVNADREGIAAPAVVQGRATTRDPTNPADTGTDEIAADEVYYEVGRLTTTVRVTNPADEDQYVDVERIDRVTLRRADGFTIALVFTN